MNFWENVITLEITSNKHSFKWGHFSLLKFGIVGLASCFLFPSLSRSACQASCANCLKRPNGSVCQETFWQTSWARAWQLHSDSLQAINHIWRSGSRRTVESTFSILMMFAASGHHWNEQETQHSTGGWMGEGGWTTFVCYISGFSAIASSPPLTGHMCCSTVHKRGAERGSMWEDGFNYAWASAPWRVHKRLTEMERSGQTAKDLCWFKDWPDFNCFDARNWRYYITFYQFNTNYGLRMGQ